MPSMYTEQYLDENQSRGGDGKGITPGTFLAYTLKGKAKRYSGRYQRALERDLASRDDVVRGHSMHNATAYYWLRNEGAK